AGLDSAGPRAGARTIHPRPGCSRTRARRILTRHAGTRPPHDGGGAVAADAAEAPVGGGDPGLARRHGQRQSARPEMAQSRSGGAHAGARTAERMTGSGSPPAGGRVAFVLKGYPRLSETFIAQEIRALEE